MDDYYVIKNVITNRYFISITGNVSTDDYQQAFKIGSFSKAQQIVDNISMLKECEIHHVRVSTTISLTKHVIPLKNQKLKRDKYFKDDPKILTNYYWDKLLKRQPQFAKFKPT